MSEPKQPKGFMKKLAQFADWRDLNKPSITTAIVEVRSETARKALGIKKGEPLVYRGMAIKCIGSKGWRNENADGWNGGVTKPA